MVYFCVICWKKMNFKGLFQRQIALFILTYKMLLKMNTTHFLYYLC